MGLKELVGKLGLECKDCAQRRVENARVWRDIFREGFAMGLPMQPTGLDTTDEDWKAYGEESRKAYDKYWSENKRAIQCKICHSAPCVALRHNEELKFMVYCALCKTSGPPALERDLAVEAWNKLCG